MDSNKINDALDRVGNSVFGCSAEVPRIVYEMDDRVEKAVTDKLICKIIDFLRGRLGEVIKKEVLDTKVIFSVELMLISKAELKVVVECIDEALKEKAKED